jgi:CBS domain-containing protein
MKTVRQVLDVKGYKLHTIHSTATVYEALQRMSHEGIGAIVVVDDGELVGIVSERDYARKVILKGRHSKDTPVGDIMTPEVICVSSDANVDLCMSVMTEKRIRHLVVREEARLAGLISIGDVVKAIIEDQQFTIEQLERYISS